MARQAIPVLAALFLVCAPAAIAQTAPGSDTYARRDECIAGQRLNAQQCEFAYRNARAEFEEKTPRYRSRAACERVHKICAVQITGIASFEDIARAGGGTYVPRFTGIRVTGSGEAARVLPVVAGAGTFAARQVAALDTRVAGRRAVIGDAPARGRGVEPGRPGDGGVGSFVRRGDRDDTIKVPLETRDPSSTAAPGLYVDRDGVEWYRPARRR
jgi:hypothetical protein